MCGVFGYSGSSNQAVEKVQKGLTVLEYRGYDSWGVCWQDNASKSLQIKKDVGSIQKVELPEVSASLAIGHTRWATHGGVTAINAHPHAAEDGSFAIVHNGIVENSSELKAKLVAAGHTFTSETDTEVIVHLLEESVTDSRNWVAAVDQVITQIEGMNSFVVLDSETHSITVVRNGSPLVLGKKNDEYFVVSDSTALVGNADQMYIMSEGEKAYITNGTLQLFSSAQAPNESVEWLPFTQLSDSTEKGDFTTYLEKEIYEQPRLLHELLHREQELKLFLQFLREFEFFDFVGCGTSFHAGILASLFFAQAGLRSRAVMGSEYAVWRSLVAPKGLSVFLSQSGETVDILEHINHFHTQKYPSTAIVNRPHSSISRQVERYLGVEAGPELSVLATKSFINTVGIAYLLAKMSKDQLDSAQQSIQEALTALKTVMTPEYRQQYITPVAEFMKPQQHSFAIGRGTLYPVALEAALKMKEGCYIHMEGFAGGELKHGAIALIEKGTPCLIFTAPGADYNHTVSNAIELKSRGAVLIGIGAGEKPEGFDFWIPTIASASIENAHLFVSIVIAQLLTLETALIKGINPDRPRNLAKSVTVK